MNRYTLDLYRQMFLSLKRGSSHGVKSNAKPIYLLSLLDIIPFKKTNLFIIHDKCLNDYYRINNEKYSIIKTTPLILPYYHLHTEPFYHISWKNENNIPAIHHSPSIKQIEPFINGTTFDYELWDLLQDEENREYLRKCIIDNYFTNEYTIQK